MSEQPPRSYRIEPSESTGVKLNIDSKGQGWERAADYKGSTIESIMKGSDQYAVLSMVAHNGPISTRRMLELNQELSLGIDDATIRKSMSRIYQKKLIDRNKNESPYKYMVNEYGLALLDKNCDLYMDDIEVDIETIEQALSSVYVRPPDN